jgi:hypothetical protein
VSLRQSLLVGAGLVAAVAMAASAATLAALGRAVGWHEPLHWALPVAVDLLALVAGLAWLAASVPQAARKLGCVLTLVSVAGSVALNAIGHLVDTDHMTVGPGLVITVSAVPPIAAALAVHLTAVMTATGHPDTSEVTTDMTDSVVEVTALPPPGTVPVWDPFPVPEVTAGMTTPATALPATQPVRKVVTLPVDPTADDREATAADVRKEARRLNRQAVKETGRPVTIDALRADLGLSRRAAAALRKEVLA